MTARADVRLSRAADLDEAIADVLRDLPDDVRLCMVYIGVAHPIEEVRTALRAQLGDIPVVGVSTQGVTVHGETLEATRFLAVCVIAGLDVRVASVEDLRADAGRAGATLGTMLGPPPAGPHVTICFYDPLGGADVGALISGLAETGYPTVYGGGAGQPWGRVVRTWQLTEHATFQHGAIVIRLDGVCAVSDLTHGATPVGLTMTATRTDANQVLELNGRPALDVWCEQLGVQAVRDVEHTANWALGLRVPNGTAYEGLITRAPFGFDEARRSLIFQATIPEGAEVQVCVRNQAAVLEGAAAMFARVADALRGRRPLLALGFECGARPSPFLGSSLAHREIVDAQARLPANLPWFGMYAWGELAPIGGATAFHNYTFPICILCVEEPA